MYRVDFVLDVEVVGKVGFVEGVDIVDVDEELNLKIELVCVVVGVLERCC